MSRTPYAWRGEHDNLLKWRDMWTTLAIFFWIITGYLVFTNHIGAGLSFSVFAFGFTLASGRCEAKHQEMHDEVKE